MTVFKVLSLGGGVQSSTIAEMIAEGDLESVDAAVFADTGDELAETYAQVEYLFGRLRKVGVECHSVSAGSLVDDIRGGGRFAAMPLFTDRGGRRGRMRRQCTSEYKIVPIEQKAREMLMARGLATMNVRGEVRANSGVTVERWLGISLDEVQRMKPARVSYVVNRWPLIDARMSRHDCVTYLQERNLPLPVRSACRVCPFHSTEYWRWLRDERPEDWQHVVEFDEFLRSGDEANRISATSDGPLFLVRECVPLSEADLSTPEERGQLRLFDDSETVCDAGHCFV